MIPAGRAPFASGGHTTCLGGSESDDALGSKVPTAKSADSAAPATSPAAMAEVAAAPTPSAAPLAAPTEALSAAPAAAAAAAAAAPSSLLSLEVEAELNAVSAAVGLVWAQGKQRFEAAVAAKGLCAAHASTSALLRDLSGRVSQAQHRVQSDVRSGPATATAAAASTPVDGHSGRGAKVRHSGGGAAAAASSSLPPQQLSQLHPRASAALAHLATLAERLSTVERALGPAPLPEDPGEGRFAARRIPADNSCLFHCVSQAFTSGAAPPLALRRRAAAFVAANRSRFSEALGEDVVANYESDMLDPAAWGGAVEVSLFAEIFGAVITVLDVEERTETVFGASGAAPGGGAPAAQAFFLFEGGNHYDLLAWSPRPGAPEVVLFNARDESSVRRARRAASALSASKMWRVESGEVQNVALLRQKSWE